MGFQGIWRVYRTFIATSSIWHVHLCVWCKLQVSLQPFSLSKSIFAWIFLPQFCLLTWQIFFSFGWSSSIVKVLECQSWCEGEARCGFFSYFSVSGLCHLSPADAQKLHPVAWPQRGRNLLVAWDVRRSTGWSGPVKGMKEYIYEDGQIDKLKWPLAALILPRFRFFRWSVHFVWRETAVAFHLSMPVRCWILWLDPKLVALNSSMNPPKELVMPRSSLLWVKVSLQVRFWWWE